MGGQQTQDHHPADVETEVVAEGLIEDPADLPVVVEDPADLPVVVEDPDGLTVDLPALLADAAELLEVEADSVRLLVVEAEHLVKLTSYLKRPKILAHHLDLTLPKGHYQRFTRPPGCAHGLTL